MGLSKLGGNSAGAREGAEKVSKQPGMTVKQAIKMLEALPDKEMKVMIDCPYCGKGNQLSSIDECVVLSSPPAREC